MKVDDSNFTDFVEGFYSSWHWSRETRTLRDTKLSLISLGENLFLLLLTYSLHGAESFLRS
jgi:hypothetical protein